MKAIFQARSVFLTAASMFVFAAIGFGQAPQLKGKGEKLSPRETSATNSVPLPAPSAAGDSIAEPSGDDPVPSEILPYYDNYLKEYRLGPSDMISVEVFGQCPDYCKTGITVPPNARIS